MKTFDLSKYLTVEELLVDKADYYENIAKEMTSYLESVELLRFDEEEGNYYWIKSGEYLGE